MLNYQRVFIIHQTSSISIMCIIISALSVGYSQPPRTAKEPPGSSKDLNWTLRLHRLSFTGQHAQNSWVTSHFSGSEDYQHSASFCNLRSNKENKFAEFRCIVWVCRGLSEIKCSKCLPFQGANRERSCPASPSALRWAGGDAIHGLYHWNLPMGSNGYIPNVWAFSMGNTDEKHVGSCSALV